MIKVLFLILIIATQCFSANEPIPAIMSVTGSVFVGDSGAGGVVGLVPAPGAGDSSKCLKGDGTWGACSGGSVSIGGSVSGGTAEYNLYVGAGPVLAQEAQVAVSRGGTNIGSYTAGDILYATGATTLAKLAVGTAGQVLTVSGGLPAWSAPAASLTVGGAITSGTANRVLYEDSSNQLAESSNLFFNGTYLRSNQLTVGKQVAANHEMLIHGDTGTAILQFCTNGSGCGVGDGWLMETDSSHFYLYSGFQGFMSFGNSVSEIIRLKTPLGRNTIDFRGGGSGNGWISVNDSNRIVFDFAGTHLITNVSGPTDSGKYLGYNNGTLETWARAIFYERLGVGGTNNAAWSEPNYTLDLRGLTGNAVAQLSNNTSGNASTDGVIFDFDGTHLNIANQETGGRIRATTTDAGFDLQTSGTKPTCNSTVRGQLFLEEGGAGVADVLYMCMKAAADTYAWETVKAAP